MRRFIVSLVLLAALWGTATAFAAPPRHAHRASRDLESLRVALLRAEGR